MNSNVTKSVCEKGNKKKKSEKKIIKHTESVEGLLQELTPRLSQDDHNQAKRSSAAGFIWDIRELLYSISANRKDNSQKTSKRNSSPFRPTVPFQADPAPTSSPHILYALHCGGNAMRNVQMHRVLPVGLTYSSTHRRSQPGCGAGWGLGVVYIPQSQPLIWGRGWQYERGVVCMWGGLGGTTSPASPVSGKGNKGPLCPVGVGPCYHGHGQVHWQEHVERGLKVGGGGKEGRARSDWVWLVMWWPGGDPAPYLLLKKWAKYSTCFTPSPLLSWDLWAFAMRTGECMKVYTQHKQTHKISTRLNHTWIQLRSSWTFAFVLYVSTSRDGVGHFKSVLNAHPGTAIDYSACRGSEWLTSTQSGFRCTLTGLTCNQWVAFNKFGWIGWILFREFQWAECQQIEMTQLLRDDTCFFLTTWQKLNMYIRAR